MDSQNQKPAVPETPPVKPAVTTPAPVPTTPKPNPNPNNDPKLNISDKEAQALLAINNLEVSHRQHNSRKPPIGLLITLATVVVIVIIASILLGSLKNKVGSNTSTSNSVLSNSTSSGTSNTATGQTTNEINQDVDSCSNPTTAISSC